MDEILKPETPLAETGQFEPEAIQALASHWISTVEQFLLRAATPEAREQLAGLLGLGEGRIEERRQDLLRCLPPEVRPGLETPPDPGPRPGMGLRLGKNQKNKKAQ